jgi:hypothetical protein
VAQCERNGLAEQALQPRAHREMPLRRKDLVELVTAVGDLLGQVLSEGGRPGEACRSPGKVRRKIAVPADYRGEVLAHAEKTGPEVLELDVERGELLVQVSTQLSRDTGTRPDLASRVPKG